MEKVRILHVLIGCGFGGVTTVVRDLLVQQILNKNIQADLLIINSKNISQKDTFESQNINVLLTKEYKKVRFNILFDKSLIDIIKKYDIIHLHSFNPFLFYLAKKCKKKVVYTLHGVLSKNTHFKMRLLDFLHKIFINNFIDYLICNSNYSLSVAKNAFGIRINNIKVIDNGVNFKQFYIDDNFRNSYKNKFIIGTVGRLAEVKRINRAINAFAKFQVGKPEVLLLIVGDGILRERLENQVSNLQISNKVIFTGYKTNVADYIAIFDICIFSSKGEAFGLVALEAMYLGKPVIVFKDGGGLPDIISKIEPHNIVNNIENCSQLINNYYDNRFEIPKNAEKRKRYAESYSIKKWRGKWQKFILK